jgi:hypothetical protein
MMCKKAAFGCCIISGGERGIRTLARIAPTNGLANRPLQPAWVPLRVKTKV